MKRNLFNRPAYAIRRRWARPEFGLMLVVLALALALGLAALSGCSGSNAMEEAGAPELPRLSDLPAEEPHELGAPELTPPADSAPEALAPAVESPPPASPLAP